MRRGSAAALFACLIAMFLSWSVPASALAADSRVLDDFVSVERWQADPSDGVKLDISSDEGRTGRAMRLDFDFGGGGGYAIARLPVVLDLPANYEFTFRIRAESATNTLEFKLIDPTGENVWWNVRRRWRFPEEWTPVRIRKRNFEFAWGPVGGGEIARTSALEIVIVAVEGGKGSVWIDDLTFTPLPLDVPYDLQPTVSATSAAAGHPASHAIDELRATFWQSAAVGEQRYEIDFLRRREFGGLVIEWGERDFAIDYDVLTSVDGDTWDTVWRVRGGDGGNDHIPIREADARYVRLVMTKSSAGAYALHEIEVETPAFSDSKNAMFRRIAAGSPEGLYPRYLQLGEQSYWTIVGAPADTREALLGQDGAIDVDPDRFSIEPFLSAGDRFLTWADTKSTTQSLADGDLPIPSVMRDYGPLLLTTTAFARGEEGHSVLWVRYRVENRSKAQQAVTLHLAIRPLQVNPSWQFLAIEGGSAEIVSIARENDAIVVNRTTTIVPLTKMEQFGALRFDQGDVVTRLAAGRTPSATSVVDPFGSASGVMSWELALAPGDSRDVVITIPFHQRPAHLRGGLSTTEASRRADAELEVARTEWQNRLGRVAIRLPAIAQHVSRAIRSNLAYILINADGPSIQPGSRSYDRSWIRDGSLTSAALLQLAHPEEVRRFIDWYARYQRPDGYVPCCVGSKGADPVPEHDSHGQFIYLIKEYYDFTGDRALLDRMWPHVQRAVEQIDMLRHQRMTPEYQTPDKLAFYGLVPESISHEGYSAKPMHSYWDGFFVLKGLKDATEIARITGQTDEETKFGKIRDEFRRDLYASINRAMATHGIDYIPGSVELGDFDATSTTVAVHPAGELKYLPATALGRTFDKYWEEFTARRSGAKQWEAYTPYEWRVVGTFVRMGQPERAIEALEWFFTHARPPEWNHWAEVVFSEPSAPKFIGDMPHTWVGSDFIRSVLDMFAYERESDESLVLGAALPLEWIEAEDGVGVAMLRTRYGALNYSMRTSEDAAIEVRIEEGLTIPPGGIVVVDPRNRRETIVRTLPARLLFTD
ncbi:MAG TPA: discoidin domain-containing protein [Thermoanaerobaculia bacterium]